MKTSEFSLRYFDQTQSFRVCTISKTEDVEMKISEFSSQHFDQSPSFSNSEFSNLGIV